MWKLGKVVLFLAENAYISLFLTFVRHALHSSLAVLE